MTPNVPVSWGELLDKITILEIKSARLTSKPALRNVRNELAQLAKIAAPVDSPENEIHRLKAALKKVNETLWEIEDRIREHEDAKLFDREFVELARAVYKSNDERGRIKREINLILKSDLIEEKQYKSYS
jgi:peptidoglycan hydrolase CwlO-like protein